MRWSKVCVEAIAYELPEERVGSQALEAKLAPLYRALKLEGGQVEALTGIRERRNWPANPKMADCASRAAKKALEQSGVPAADLGAVIYAGVCRDNLEPATACAVAEAIGTGPDALVFDVSNACLGVLNGIVEIANKIELGHAQAGLVVSAETSREINENVIDRMVRTKSVELFRESIATLTGVIWYRLPTERDALNWRWPTLAAVMQGRAPQAKLTAELRRPEAGLVEVELTNTGEADHAGPVAVVLRGPAGALLASDALGGFGKVDATARSLQLRAQGQSLRLAPGERRAVGWLRFKDHADVEVQILPP